jgi:glycerophosphoryl diester phosphodiesterase
MRIISFLRAIIFISFTLSEVYAQVLPAPRNGDIYVIAHRGAHIGIPENSLAAYQKAIDLGCDFVEIDVRTTKDNQYVSVHNSTIDAYVEGKSGKVNDMTLAELKQLDIGIRIGKQWKNTRIPTFEEILQLCQNRIGIYLDLKDADPAGLVAIIQKYNMEKQIVWCIWGSEHKTIMDIKYECPKCIPMPDPGEEKNLEKVMVAYQPNVVASMMSNYTASFGKAVHERGAIVFVDDSENYPDKLKQEWNKMIKWKVDGIQTDRPEELIKFIQGKY